MLRITIELVPHGDESRARPLETFNIVNTGIDTSEGHIYRCTWRDQKGVVIHNRENHVFELVLKALEELKQ